jgi:hypothetical protein
MMKVGAMQNAKTTVAEIHFKFPKKSMILWPVVLERTFGSAAHHTISALQILVYRRQVEPREGEAV